MYMHECVISVLHCRRIDKLTESKTRSMDNKLLEIDGIQFKAVIVKQFTNHGIKNDVLFILS